MSAIDRISGRATAAGTARFASKFSGPRARFRRPDGFTLSSLGMGTRSGVPGGRDDLAYRTAALRAIELGANVFDSSISYRMQTSERALGSALRRAFDTGLAERDEIYVVTKGGYLTVDAEHAQNGADARRYLIRAYVDTGLVDPNELVNGNHALEPGFMVDQIVRSRENLGLEVIDLYCVENPELHLWAKGPTEFWKQLGRVIEALETEVANGSIGAYGLSTWTGLLVPHAERGHLAVTELFELALEIGGADHHLRAIQVPYSVAMGEALGLPSQFGPAARQQSLFETLAETGTTVMTTAPLVQGRATRGLPPFLREAFPELETDAQRCLQFARSAPGVTTTLVGMRELAHVEENLRVAEFEPATAEVLDSLYRWAESDPSA